MFPLLMRDNILPYDRGCSRGYRQIQLLSSKYETLLFH